MGYIGTPIDTRNQFQSLQGKRFNGDGSTTDFTLDVAPSSTLDIEVFVGNVRQDPNSAYTLSGTTLSFTGAPPSGTNNIYVVHQAKSVGTINPGANSVGVTELNLSDGSNGQVLQTNGSGTLSFATVDTSSATDSFTISGSTPTLTIGDAGAEDTKIVFDGNAQDFHIGLDDSADDLVIGLGSTLGTTTHMAFDEIGAVTKPLQPAFLVDKGNDNNVTGDGTDYTQQFDIEVFDTNADFDTSSHTFTAPVTGKYFLFFIDSIENPTNQDRFVSTIKTSNRNYSMEMQNVETGNNMQVHTISVVADMDANDTCTFNTLIKIEGGSGNKTINSRDDSFCGGYLLG